MRNTCNIVVLSGAGISAESGLKTFRDAEGLWEGHRIEEVATPEAFEENPELVHQFYNLRRLQLREVHPNQAHLALVDLELEWQKHSRGSFLLVTQNVDDLHERAGTQNLLHMHGELLKVKCVACDFSFRFEESLTCHTQCTKCGAKGRVRPDIVWFGEKPYFMGQIEDALSQCNYFISIGTSGQVYPAAGFVAQVPSDCKTVECNLISAVHSSRFQEHRYGKASEILPQLVLDLLRAP